jgi:hypothetical protein
MKASRLQFLPPSLCPLTDSGSFLSFQEGSRHTTQLSKRPQRPTRPNGLSRSEANGKAAINEFRIGRTVVDKCTDERTAVESFAADNVVDINSILLICRSLRLTFMDASLAGFQKSNNNALAVHMDLKQKSESCAFVVS